MDKGLLEGQTALMSYLGRSKDLQSSETLHEEKLALLSPFLSATRIMHRVVQVRILIVLAFVALASLHSHDCIGALSATLDLRCKLSYCQKSLDSFSAFVL